MSYRTAPKRGINLDYLMWLFTRLSALAMYLLAITGITAALIMGARTEMKLPDLIRWAFMPNANHVRSTSVPDILAWKGIFWQSMGILVLFFAGTHGLNGLRNILEDYLGRPWVRKALRVVLFLVWAFMITIGIYVIRTL